MPASSLATIGYTFLKAASASVRSRSASPELTASLADQVQVRVDPARLARFRQECGFPDDGYLPVSYPHALCGIMHTQLLSRRGFPFPVFGVMHVRHAIQQRRRIEPDELLSLDCRVGDPRTVRSGYEYDLVTECQIENEVVWSEVTTFLVMAKTDSGERPDIGPSVPERPDGRDTWNVDVRQGWRFARASDDYNPIHLSRKMARMFGLRSSLAHGMWVLARALAQVEALDGADALDVKAYFRRPLWLPASAELVHRTDDGTSTFAVLRPKDNKPHLVGTAVRR